MKRLRFYIFSLIVGLLITSGCTTDKSTTNQTISPSGKSSFSDFISQLQWPDKVQVTFNSEIDPSVDAAKTYNTIDFVFNQETVIKYLMYEGIVKKTDYAEGPGYLSKDEGIEEYLNFYTKSAKGGFVYNLKLDSTFVGTKLSSIVSDEPGPMNELRYDNRQNKFDFGSYTDLPFMRYQEAQSMILSMLNQMGFPDIAISESYSLDLQTILDHDAAPEAFVSDETETDDTEFTFTWSTEDECYLFLIQQTVDNIPIISTAWETTSADSSPGGSWMPYTYITAYLANRGIISLKASGLYEVRSETSEQQLISASAAVQILANDLSARIIGNPTDVQSIQLCYVSVPGKSQYELKPAWCFGISETKTSSKDAPPEVPDQYHEISYFVIDAVTGEKMSV